jgi:glycosyltransferase involved in cell wall biosynthesis
MTTNTECDFSVIVPTYNEERNLPRLLTSLASQKGVAYEVIVVDQQSTDQTTKIAADAGCIVLNRPRSAFYSPPAASRNAGAAASHGTFLVHLDADMELSHSDFLASLRDLFSHDTQAVIIHERDVATGYWARVKAVERLCYTGSPIESARAVTRTLFQQVGGYNAAISSGEDYDISHRYRFHTGINIDHALTLNHYTGRVPLSLLLRKKFSYGRTVNRYLSESRSTGGPSAFSLISIHMKCFLRRRDLLATDPVHFLGIFVLRALEFLAILTGLGFGTVARSGRGHTAA